MVRITVWLCLVSCTLTSTTFAGGPRYIAGSSYFDPSVKGMPITWSQGIVTYYTDQGDLSPILLHSAADAFVADAFTRWTQIPTAALQANLAGQLAEDVSGSNVGVNGDGTVSMPLDILPGATATPLAVVYDRDGTVTDALIGQTAGNSENCFSNAVFGGPDNFSTDGHIVHALVVLNGNCAQSSQQLPEVEYRLVRTLGGVLGLGWSQANVNVLSGKPIATSADYVGFPVMHAADPSPCVPISKCYSNNADQPKMDDQAALARLYPVTAQNQANFPGKTLLAESTIRIHGSVFFADAYDAAAQPMQGVNVVARWIDPATGKPSRAYVATSISGFLFRGNAGNPANGFVDVNGVNYDKFGTDDKSVEGSYDLGGLPIPNGAQSAQYQITAEPIDPLFSQTAGPYSPYQVQPSGTLQPIVITANIGDDLQQDIVMAGSAIARRDGYDPTSYATPATLPVSGEWVGTIDGYGNGEYFSFSGHADRTIAIDVTALDETGSATQVKAQPVIGMWGISDPGTFPAPANTFAPMNTFLSGTTRLTASLLQTTGFRLGIFDQRGDGRPDYRYRARVFYGDTLSSGRVSTEGGPLQLRGFGFRANTVVQVGGTSVPILARGPNRMVVGVPPHPDGLQDVVVTDPSTGATSTMSGALTYGAGPNDLLNVVSGANPAVPLGTMAPFPFVVRVVSSDGLSPIPGATVVFSSSPPAALAACNGGTACTILSDQSGQASTIIAPLAAGSTYINAQLAPASYGASKQVQTIVVASSSALDIAVGDPKVWSLLGCTLDVPVSVRVLSNGVPLGGLTVRYSIAQGAATFSSATSVTDVNGYATTTLHTAALSSQVTGNACVTSSGISRCASLIVYPLDRSAVKLQAVIGVLQQLTVGQAFHPVTIRAVDSSTPPNPVVGIPVMFQSVLGRTPNNVPAIWIGESAVTQNPMPVVLASSTTTVTSDVNGLATFQPGAGEISGPVLILGTASFATNSVGYQMQSLP